MESVEQTDEQKEQIRHAVRFATEKHDGQFREGSGLPYIVHPIAVLSQVAEWEVTDHVARLAAVTHDVREDCGVSHEELLAVVGVEAASVVCELSFFPNLKSDVPKHVQKQEYMRNFMMSSIPALVVKLADRCCNTYDWMAAGNPYAKKYWGKANDLFSAFVTRRNEIIEYYGGPEKVDGKKNPQRIIGETIYIKMQYTHTCIKGMIQ